VNANFVKTIKVDETTFSKNMQILLLKNEIITSKEVVS